MLTEADRAVIAGIVEGATIRGPAFPGETFAELYSAFSGRGEATLCEVGAHAATLWTARLDRVRELTDADLDEALRLKAKGFGAWDQADLDSFADLTLTEELLTRPWVEQLLMPSADGPPVEAI